MTPATTTRVYVAISDGVLLLDLGGVVEPLRLANRHSLAAGSAIPPFALQVVASQPSVISSVAVGIAGCQGLPAELGGTQDDPAWVFVIGITKSPDGHAAIVREDGALVAWLQNTVGKALFDGRVRLFTICSAALLAARAGLLDGRRCTTHHELLDHLAGSFPAAIVERDRLYVADGAVATSAGVTSAIDLTVAAIHARCGIAVAHAVARDLVMYWRRAGHDPQLSPLLDHRNHLHPAVHRAQDAVLSRPEQPWTVVSMAAAGCVSERHIRRLFVEHAQITPLAYVHRVRVAIAERIVATENLPMERIAERVGFRSARQLRDARRRLVEEAGPR
jgi:transcriptional regulator GlxA family with amidase domain